MEKKHHEGRTIAIERITQYLAALVKRVEISVKNNLSNTAVSAETIMAGVLNRMYHWNLENANSEQQNFPGVDLVDEDACVAVQVTSTNSVKKVNKTLEKFTAYHLGERFNRLIVLVITNENPTDGMKLKKLEPWFVGAKDIWNIPSLLQKMMSLDADILADIAAYLSKELGIAEEPAVRIPTHRLPPVPAPSSSFVPGSRDRELEDLKNMLSPDAPVFLYGVGGIGKTEVAIQLARNFAPPEGAYFLHYYDTEGEALRETILRANFTDYTYNKPDNDHRDQEYKERMDILSKEYPGALLVIDNFDIPGRSIAQLQAEPAYRELTAMGIRLVFTTRSRVKNGYEIKPLDETYLLTLMRENLDGVDVSDDQLRRLIEAVEGHTLMTVLMARTLAESWGDVTPETILEALRNSDLNRAEFPEVVSDQNQSYEQRQIYAHMRALFDLSRLSESDQGVLRYAALLPTDGMGVQTFRKCLDNTSRKKTRRWNEWLFGKKAELIPSEREAFDHLIKTGWLAADSKTGLLTIHPVIREICWENLKPTEETCQNFLQQLSRRIDWKETCNLEEYSQIAKYLAMASDRFEDPTGALSWKTARLWYHLGQDRLALPYVLRARNRHEENLIDAGIGMAHIYSLQGSIYHRLGEYEKALEVYFEALVESERYLLPDNPRLAIQYDNMGTICCELGDYQAALEYQMKALEIFEKALPDDHQDLATVYNNVGSTYGKLGDYGKAMEYQVLSLKVLEEAQKPDYLAIAAAHNNFGGLCEMANKTDEALECYLKAMAIREYYLPADHPDLAESYQNVGGTYRVVKEYTKAVEYLQKAIRIYEENLSADHPKLAYSYDSLGSVYFEQGNYQKAMEHAQKAFEIRKKSLPANHPDVANSYYNFALVYSETGKYGMALDCLEKALEISAEMLSADHPHIVSIKRKIDCVRQVVAQQEKPAS